jgi:hypothetical protein
VDIECGEVTLDCTGSLVHIRSVKVKRKIVETALRMEGLGELQNASLILSSILSQLSV